MEDEVTAQLLEGAKTAVGQVLDEEWDGIMAAYGEERQEFEEGQDPDSKTLFKGFKVSIAIPFTRTKDGVEQVRAKLSYGVTHKAESDTIAADTHPQLDLDGDGSGEDDDDEPSPDGVDES